MPIFPSFFVNKTGGYEIEQSLRFDGSGTYLQRTPSSSGNRQKFTISFWIKRGQLGSHQQNILTGNANDGLLIAFTSTDELYLYDFGIISGGFQIWSQKKFRDPSAWYHIVFAADTTQATASNRVKVWINGVQEDLSTYNLGAGAQRYPGQNGTFDWNHTNSHEIGYTNTDSFEGYLAEIHNVDSSQLNHEDFGEYDDSGVWRPKRYTGSYGTNGFYLKFDPSATNGIGHDHSGNGNNFTPSGFSTSGTGTDVMSDTPTTNWCTLNPLSFGPSNADMVEGNLRFNQPTSTRGNAKGTIAVSSGKWYWEVTPQTTATANVAGGILGAAETDTALQPGNYATGYSYYSTGETRHNNVDATYGDSYGAGDVIGTALDLDAGTLVFYKNGVSQGTAYSSVSGTFVPAIGDTSTGSGSQLVCNFGQRDFAYTPPTGFNALNTSNLPAPDIADGSDYFNTVLYTGVSGSQSVDAGMATDLAWIKSRSGSQSHSLTDRVRGNDLVLQSNETSAEASGDIDLTSTGVTIGNNNALRNAVGTSYVLWSWLAGGSGSSNTDGSITSTVSVNPSAGFSIVSYTGNNTAGATVGHGLGVAPAFIITKNRDNSSAYWATYHQSLGTSKKLYLNDTQAPDDASGWLGVSSSVITWNQTGANNVNVNGDNFICYCFAEVEGYSKISSYTANASSDGPFIYCGFKPSLIIFKNTSTTEAWSIFDTARNDYNGPDAKMLLPSSSAAESTSASRDIDFLSNGFKIRSNALNPNTASGNVYIYAAFAEHPFGGDGVSPATAR